MMQLVSAKRHETGQRTYLNISLGLVGNFHDELGLSIDHVLQDLIIDAVVIH